MDHLYPKTGRGRHQSHRVQYAVVAQLVEQLHGGQLSPAHDRGNPIANPESRSKPGMPDQTVAPLALERLTRGANPERGCSRYSLARL